MFPVKMKSYFRSDTSRGESVRRRYMDFCGAALGRSEERQNWSKQKPSAERRHKLAQDVSHGSASKTWNKSGRDGTVFTALSGPCELPPERATQKTTVLFP